jgi:UDP-N-acetylmuramyl pentapeptide phosphotransferase/UDP-N-acetylglucosamine-1-phosphate transferase
MCAMIKQRHIIAVPVSKTLKVALQKLAKDQNRKLAQFVRMHLQQVAESANVSTNGR